MIVTNYLDAYHVLCPECHRPVKNLKKHLLEFHRWSYMALEHYRTQNPSIIFTPVDLSMLEKRE